MIYVTGDTHGERARLLHQPWTAADTLIVCGDFGFLYYDNDEETAFLDRIEQTLPFTVCFVDGNHENFSMIDRYPVETWHGGQVHRIRKNVLHLMRGQVFSIEEKTFFTFGGAYSIDRYMRVRDVSYWEEELPTDDEYKRAVAVLKANGMRVDYVLTHTAPLEIVRRMGYVPDPHGMELEGFLEYIMYEASFTHWFFGHWHEDRTVMDRFTALWTDVVCLKGN